MRLCVSTAVVALMGSSAVEAAVWDDFPVLVCRGTSAIDCSIAEATCRRLETNAVWRVDFRANRITYLGGDFTEVILSKNVQRYRGRPLTEDIFLDSGRIMEFEAPRRDPVTGPRIRATLVGTAFGDMNGIQFECGPLP